MNAVDRNLIPVLDDTVALFDEAVSIVENTQDALQKMAVRRIPFCVAVVVILGFVNIMFGRAIKAYYAIMFAQYSTTVS